MSASWINKLNESDSRLYKEDIIKQALEAAILGNDISAQFLRGLRFCYNPFITFGIKRIPETVGIINAENPWTELFAMMHDLMGRELTGHAARDAIQDMAERFDSNEWNIFIAPILRRDMRSGISESTINKVVAGTQWEIPVFGCQLATNCEDRPEMRGIKRLEPKLDGVRILLIMERNGIVTSYSRNGKVFDNFTHIEDQLRNVYSDIIYSLGPEFSSGIVFDGEIVSESFQKLMGQARRKANVQNEDSIFHIFDVLPLSDFRHGHWNAQLSKRIKLLHQCEIPFGILPNVELLPHIDVDLDTEQGVSDFQKYCNDMVESGFEGVMIKDFDAPYECKRNKFWLKYKPTITVDLQVVGVEEGTGKNVGKMGALVCHGVDAGREITVNVGSGFEDQFRAQIWADITNAHVCWTKKSKGKTVIMTEYPSGQNCIGDIAEVLCDAITQNKDGTYSLRFPRFVRFRDDKA